MLESMASFVVKSLSLCLRRHYSNPVRASSSFSRHSWKGWQWVGHPKRSAGPRPTAAPVRQICLALAATVPVFSSQPRPNYFPTLGYLFCPLHNSRIASRSENDPSCPEQHWRLPGSSSHKFKTSQSKFFFKL
jgi:hypothetical protein